LLVRIRLTIRPMGRYRFGYYNYVSSEGSCMFWLIVPSIPGIIMKGMAIAWPGSFLETAWSGLTTIKTG
jgi:hypothetical protein